MRDNKQEIFIYRTSQFERCLDDLRREKGGFAAMAAKKVSEFISCLVSGDELTRKKFSYTWNGEHRIEHCKKIDLVGGYRLVLIQKDHHFIFLYAGSHDDCFRWIERNKGLRYEVDQATYKISIVQGARNDAAEFPEDVMEEKKFVERYEKELLQQLDDDLLARIFSGLRGNEQGKSSKDAQ